MRPILASVAAAMCAAVLSDVSAGLSGAALAAVVAADCRPSAGVEPAMPSSWWEDASEVFYIVPTQWWEPAPADAFNVLLAPAALVEARRDYVPGDVSVASAEGEGWAVGVGPIGLAESDMWNVAPDRLGDLARRYMYLALVYPQSLWHGRAVMVMTDGGWPLLTSYGRTLLLGWSRLDPIDAREQTESAALGALQGNYNPFVTIPGLEEYLWGVHAGEPLPDTPADPVVPPAPAAVQLKARYSIAADSIIFFTSPYVPADASWTVDGVAVGESATLESLGTGSHEAAFTSPSAVGSMIFTVEP